MFKFFLALKICFLIIWTTIEMNYRTQVYIVLCDPASAPNSFKIIENQRGIIGNRTEDCKILNVSIYNI